MTLSILDIQAQDGLKSTSVLQVADTLLATPKILQKLDSATDLSNYYLTNPLDSAKVKFQFGEKAQKKVDSLSNLPSYYLSKVDSLIQKKAQLLQDKISNLQAQATGTFTEKLTGLDSLSTSNNFLDEKLSGVNLEKYTGEMTEINGLLNKYKSKITDADELSWVENYTGQLNQLEGIMQQYQGKLMNLEELQILKGYGQQLQQLSQESQGYFQEAQGLVSGGLSEDSPLMKSLESKIGHHQEFQELQKQTAELEKIKSMPADYQEEYSRYQDQEYLKKKALAQAKKLGTKHFAQHKDKLEAAQKKLAAYKKKYSSIQSTKDMSTAVKRNSLEGKPLSDRLVLGGTLQINREPTSMDLSPLIGYRLNRKFTLGIGVTYRAVLDFDEFKAEDQVYGYRAFLQREVIRGFLLHGEYENLNSAIEAQPGTGEFVREWRTNALVGIGKQYSLVKDIKGQVLVLYNLLHDEGLTPYDKRFVIRFGFVL